jgi:nicotinamide mononucleotide transporter
MLVALGTAGMTVGLRAAGGSAPVLDAFTTVLSLAAQWLLNRKSIENWYVWITADVLYIYLYVSRGLHLTAVLYAVFLGLCIAGLVAWRRTLTASQTALDVG